MRAFMRRYGLVIGVGLAVGAVVGLIGGFWAVGIFVLLAVALGVAR